MPAVPAIMVVGSSLIDLIIYVDDAPEAGQTVRAGSFAQGFGGKGANQAVAASRLGAAVTMVSAVGEDTFGADTLANYKTNGVDATHVHMLAGETSGVAPITVDRGGQNRICVYAGANDRVDAAMVNAAFDTGRPEVVICQFEVPDDAVTAAFGAGRRAGALNILNPAPYRPVRADVAALVDWLIPNESEFAGLGAATLGRDVSALESADVAAVADAVGLRVVVTLGAGGAWVAQPGATPVRVHAPAVTVVDTTGAGDCFVGAFAVALGQGNDPVDAVRYGCQVASVSVTGRGTQTSFPYAGDLKETA